MPGSTMTGTCRHGALRFAVALIALFGHVDIAGAQQTRAEEYAEAQQQKASAPVGPLESRGERIARMIQRVGIPPTGFFPFIGNIYPGSWLAVGPGYRRPFQNGAIVLARGAWSLKNFKTADVLVSSPSFAGDRVRVEAGAEWLDAPSVNYFGTGNDTDRDDRVRFGLRPFGANVSLQYRPVRFLSVGGGWGIERHEARPPRNAGVADVDLTLSATTISATADWRVSPGWASSGGAIRFTWKANRSLGSDDVAFDAYEGEVTQLVPILRGNWVIALHGVATTTDASKGDIPFFLLPSVGGATARGFSNFRFRDRHRLGTAAELRWSASQFMDLALFVDAARVAATRGELDLDGLHTSVGLGARFHTLVSTVFRAELAKSRDGFRFTVGAGPVF